MSFKLQAWLVAVLAAGVLAAWVRARRDPESKTARGRLRQLGWCLAFVALTISVTATVTPLFERNGLVSWVLIIAAGVAVLLALRRSDVGHLGVGARADLVMLEAPSHSYLAYRPGVPLVAGVWKSGELVP